MITHRQVHFRPCLEVLEDRALLSTIIELPRVDGQLFVPTAINASGQIAGTSKETTDGNPHDEAFLDTNGAMTDLGSLDPIFGSDAYGINDSGQVVGTSWVNNFAAHAALSSDGKMNDLGTLLPPDSLGGFSVAYGINSSGQVVGYSQAGFAGLQDHAFLYSNGQMIDLNSQLPINSDWGRLTDAVSINDSGQIVGDGGDQGQARAFLDDGGSITDLGTLGGSSSSASAINDLDQVVGSAETASGQTHAFLYSQSEMTDLGTLPGGTTSSAVDVNDLGQVIGYSNTAMGGEEPFLYSNGKMMDLNSLLPARSGWEIEYIYAINDKDQIIGTGTHNGQFVTFLLTLDTADMATRLVVTTQPPPIVVGAQPFDVKVSVEDTNGNVDHNFNGSVTIQLSANPSNAALGGTRTVNVVNGVADFPDLTLDKLGAGYTMQATSAGLIPVTTNAFNVATWIPLMKQVPASDGAQNMLLLPDGTVMIHGDGDSSPNFASPNWYLLSPDSTGNYASNNAQITPLASMTTGRRYFASEVLPNDTVFVYGGEDTTAGSMTETNSGEYFTLGQSNMTPWGTIQTIPSNFLSSGTFGDQSTELLANGQILSTDPGGNSSFVFNVSSNQNDSAGTWSGTGNNLNTIAANGLSPGDNEDNWVLLPNGDVLGYMIGVSDANPSPSAELYVPAGGTLPANEPNNAGGTSTGQWVDASSGLIQLTSGPTPNGGPADMGPGVLLPFYAPFNGPAVIYFGSNGSTACYNPALNSWSAGPPEPTFNGQQMSSADGPAAVLPNGEVLIALSPLVPPPQSAAEAYQIPPTHIYLYNPNGNFSNGTPFLDVSPNDPNLISNSAYLESMLVLPTGQILMSDSTSKLWIFTLPAALATPATNSQPTISSITPNRDGTFTLTGTHLNGVTQGAYDGDDEEMASNYPIIQLRKSASSDVYYATTKNWTGTGESVHFSTSGIPAGTYTLYVIANGISSIGQSFTVELPPSLSPASVSATTVGIPYSQSITASGGTGTTTLTYKITSTTQPADLGITFTGNTSELDITGKPTAAGTVTFSVTATDSLGITATQNYTLTVNPVNVTGQVSNTASGLIYNRATQLFGGTIKLTNNGSTTLVGALAVELTGLPSGVTLANASGVNTDGTPYIYVTLPNGTLAPGQSVTFTVQFFNPKRLLFSYSLLVFDENASS